MSKELKYSILTVFLLLAVSTVSATDDFESFQESSIQEEQDNLILEEETINITDITDEIPDPLKLIFPEQRVQMKFELPEEAPEGIQNEYGLEVGSALRTVNITSGLVEDPTLEVTIGSELMDQSEPAPEDLPRHLEEENIVIEAHGFLNTLVVTLLEKSIHLFL